MEFYMGRTLTNTMLNLGIQNACDEALYQVVMCTCVVWYLLFYSDFFLNLKLIKAAQTALIVHSCHSVMLHYEHFASAILFSLCFNSHFPREAGLASFIGAKMEVVVTTTEAIRRTKLQSNRHHQQTNTQHITGRMPFLSPN